MHWPIRGLLSTVFDSGPTFAVRRVARYTRPFEHTWSSSSQRSLSLFALQLFPFGAAVQTHSVARGVYVNPGPVSFNRAVPDPAGAALQRDSTAPAVYPPPFTTAMPLCPGRPVIATV